MSFLAPLFLAGLAALTIPVVIHLQRRHRSRTVEFPSLMFLESMQLPSRRRRRIRDWLLLLLRCLALVLLVLAFARPWLDSGVVSAATEDEGRTLVVMVDNSFSMGLDGRFERARSAAADAVAGIGPNDEGSILVFSDAARVLLEPSSDPAILTQAANDLELGAQGTRFGPAFRMARKILLESASPRREVVLITDFQRSGWQGEEPVVLPPGTEIRYVDLSERDRLGASPANLAVADVIFDYDTAADRERVSVQARIANRGSRSLEGVDVALELDGRELQSRSVDVDGGEIELVVFDRFSLPEGISKGVVRVAGDRLESDNRFYFALSRSQAVPVLLVERDRVNNPSSGFYLERALDLSQRPPHRVTRISDRRFDTANLDGRAVVFLSDVPAPTGAVGDRLARFVEEGGGLFVALGSNSEENRHAALADVGLLPRRIGAPVRQGSGRAASRISYFDRNHPGFVAFSAPRSGDFGSARFFRYHRLEPESGVDRVLARFDDGQPALIERLFGEGRVLVWTSTLDRYWNDFALKPIFVPFVHQSVRHLSDFRPLEAWHTVGEIVDLGVLLEGEGASASDLESIETPGTTRADTAELLTLSEPGFYELELADESTRALAVNVEGAESDLTTLDPEELIASVSPEGVEETALVDAELLSPEEHEGAQGLWRYLVVTAVLVLLTETFLSNRRRTPALATKGTP